METLTKEYKVDAALSAATAGLLHDDGLELRSVGEAHVRGKSKTLSTFTLGGHAAVPASELTNVPGLSSGQVRERPIVSLRLTERQQGEVQIGDWESGRLPQADWQGHGRHRIPRDAPRSGSA